MVGERTERRKKRKETRGRKRKEQDGLPPHLQPQVESPGNLDHLDLGQERAHKLFDYCSCCSLVFHQFFKWSVLWKPREGFQTLYFQVTKVGDRANETLVMVPGGGGPQRKPPVCTPALRSPRHFTLEGWLFDVCSGNCCPVKLHPHSKDSLYRGISQRTWERVPPLLLNKTEVLIPSSTSQVPSLNPDDTLTVGTGHPNQREEELEKRSMEYMGKIRLSHAGNAEFSHRVSGGDCGPPRDREKLGQRQGGSLPPWGRSSGVPRWAASLLRELLWELREQEVLRVRESGLRDSHAPLAGRCPPLVTVSGTRQGCPGLWHGAGSCHSKVFMLMPLVRLAALRAAGLDRKAAGSPGLCFPGASPRSPEMSNKSLAPTPGGGGPAAAEGRGTTGLHERKCHLFGIPRTLKWGPDS